MRGAKGICSPCDPMTASHETCEATDIFITHLSWYTGTYLFQNVKVGKHQSVASSTCLDWGTEPTNQACALTGNRTSDPLPCRVTPNQLSHTGQGRTIFLLSVRWTFLLQCLAMISNSVWLKPSKSGFSSQLLYFGRHSLSLWDYKPERPSSKSSLMIISHVLLVIWYFRFFSNASLTPQVSTLVVC